VPGTDDDGVDRLVPDGERRRGGAGVDADQYLRDDGVRGRRVPRMANGRASPGKW
jgi:hypothetical protein